MTQMIENGVIDQFVYFDAPPGLATWVVYGSLDGAAAAVFTTPTVNETDSTNMPGVYELLLDEQTTIGANNTSEILKLFISAGGWSGKSIEVVLFDNLINVTNLNSVVSDWLDAGRLDVLLDAIKAKTDSLTFTGTNVQADVVKVAGGTDLVNAGSGGQLIGET